MAHDITKFVRGKSGVCGNSKIMNPEFGLFIAGTYVNMGGFVSFVGIEERAIRTPAEDGRHVELTVVPQYRFAIGSSSAGNSVITRQPLSVTTTSSSMRAAE